MQLPNIKNIIEDPKKGVKYNIIAYRKLSKPEMIEAVRYYHTQKKVKKPKRGNTVNIITITGYDD